MTRNRSSSTPFALALASLFFASAPAGADQFLGRLAGNPHSPSSTANKHGVHGSRHSATSITNPYSRWGSRYSTEGVRNPHTTGGPRIVAEDGTYLGRLNANRYDPESVSNPFGRFGSPDSLTSINNPHSPYGSRHSPLSPNNPFSLTPPVLIGK